MKVITLILLLSSNVLALPSANQAHTQMMKARGKQHSQCTQDQRKEVFSNIEKAIAKGECYVKFYKVHCNDLDHDQNQELLDLLRGKGYNILPGWQNDGSELYLDWCRPEEE